MPTYEQFMKPVLLALNELGGTATLQDLDKKATEIMQLPVDIITIPHKSDSNRTEVDYRLAWARTYLKKYGLIKERKPWHLVFNRKV